MLFMRVFNVFCKSVAVFSLFVFFRSVAPVHGAQGFAVMSVDLGLSNQPGWYLMYNPFDSPEGGFLGTISEGQSSLNGEVQLGRVLEPGRYYVAWKVLDYNFGGSLDFSIGGSSSATAVLNSADVSGQWTVPVAIDVPAAGTTVHMTLRRSLAQSYRQIFNLRGLYVTTSSGEVVFFDDSILNPQYPTQLDNTPARKGNILDMAGDWERQLRGPSRWPRCGITRWLTRVPPVLRCPRLLKWFRESTESEGTDSSRCPLGLRQLPPTRSL
jgi:hypothetical protein